MPDELKVDLEHLRAAATAWDQAATSLKAASDSAKELQKTRIQAGPFQASYSKYRDTVEYISARMAEGSASVSDIGSTLRAAADTYEREDAEGAHNLSKAGQNGR